MPHRTHNTEKLNYLRGTMHLSLNHLDRHLSTTRVWASPKLYLLQSSNIFRCFCYFVHHLYLRGRLIVLLTCCHGNQRLLPTVHSSFCTTLQLIGLSNYSSILPLCWSMTLARCHQNKAILSYVAIETCWPPFVFMHSLYAIHPSVASSCCTIKIGGDKHNASHPPVNHSCTWITQPPWGDYLHESFNLISAYLRQMSQEILLCACYMYIFSIGIHFVRVCFFHLYS